MNKQFKSIDEVWSALDAGQTVYWGNESYKVYIEPDYLPQVTAVHKGRKFSARNGQLLSVRCISNYFGSIITPQCLGNLFTKGGSNE